MGEIPRLIHGVPHPEIDLSGLNLGSSGCASGGREIMEIAELGAALSSSSSSSSSPALTEGVMFVALGKDVKASERLLKWALDNSRGLKICILHVHQPAKTMPMMGTKVPIQLMDEREVSAYHQIKREEMNKILDKYIRICDRRGVRAEKISKEMDSIEKGIVQFISENKIMWLVMGAAADKQYSKNMNEIRSNKAIYVRADAPSFCHIWFICKGNLIHTRESKSASINIEAGPLPFQASLPIDVAWSLRSHSVAERGNSQINSRQSAIDFRRVRSDNHVVQHSRFSGSEVSSPQSCLNPEGNSDMDCFSMKSPVSSHISTSSSEIIDLSALIPPRPELNDVGSEPPHFNPDHGDRSHSSVAVSAIEGSMDDDLYDRLNQFAEEADRYRKEAYEESVRRKKAEKEVIDLIRRAKECETMHAQELRCRRELEEVVERDREEAAMTKWKLGKVLNDLRVVQEQQFTLQHKLVESAGMVEELKQKMSSADEKLQKCQMERDILQFQRDDALRVANELKERQAERASSSSACHLFPEFSLFEIVEATNNFSQSSKIGQGGYGSIYRGILRHTQVAIKVLHPNSLQGPVEFRQEVNILSGLRHPNIVNLIGACPGACALIYEFLPNGSLEDRLNCENNTPPLSWKTRVHIAAELCSALIFLHSSQPQGIVHGDLKPSNILLDANFVCKLGDFGICRQLIQDEYTETNGTQFWKTESPRGTPGYIDPEFLETGELTSKSDVYSFGIILLRLLTGRPALRIAREVQSALENGCLQELIDPMAGDWPFVQAKQLTHLALSCSNIKRRDRPDLASEVWRLLEPMKISSGSVMSPHYSSEDCRQIPSYFACPIFQEVMQDPVVAADGFTYESEAIKGWLEGGHNTSPMTNLDLPHSNLLPNYALRSAIQEWRQTSQN